MDSEHLVVRFGALERIVHRQRILLAAVMLVGLAGLLLAASGRTVPDEVIARKFTLVSESGAVLGRIEPHGDGAQLVLQSSDTRAILDDTALRLEDADETPSTVVKRASIGLFAPDGTDRVTLNATQMEGVVGVSEPGRSPGAPLTAALVAMRDMQGFLVLDESGTPLVSLAQVKAVASLNLRGGAEPTRIVTINASADEAIIATGVNGEYRTYIMSDATQQGVFLDSPGSGEHRAALASFEKETAYECARLMFWGPGNRPIAGMYAPVPSPDLGPSVFLYGLDKSAALLVTHPGTPRLIVKDKLGR